MGKPEVQIGNSGSDLWCTMPEHLASFTPGSVEYENAAALEAIGTTSWRFGRGYDEQALTKQLARLPELKREICRQAGPLGHRVGSIALVDWTSVDNTCLLMQPNFWRVGFDPFVAIVDLSAVLCAVIFYDRVLVLDYGEMARKANEVLGLDQVFRSIDPDSLPSSDRPMRQLLNALFVSAIDELDHATVSKEPWMDHLKSAWRQLLPDENFSAHTYDNYGESCGYTASPQRESGVRMIFSHGDLEGAWLRTAQGEPCAKMILDNDVRTLFYEYLTGVFAYMFKDRDHCPEVRYIGGCLRTPMLSARAQWAENWISTGFRSPAELWLAKEWRKSYTPVVMEQVTLQLPFWMNAAFARARKREDIPTAVQELRKAAKGFRKHRADLTNALRRGNMPTTLNYQAALRGTTDEFVKRMQEIARTSLEVTKVTAKWFNSVPVASASELASIGLRNETAARWLRQFLMRVFRPQLWFIYEMGRMASEAQNSLQLALDMFEVRGPNWTKPREFLTRLGNLSWVG